MVNEQFYLFQRPVGLPTADFIKRRETPVPDLDEGQFLINNHYFSLDPAIRGWMSDAPSYMPPIAIGEAIRSSTVGVVVSSRHPNFDEGDFVYGINAWERYSVSDGYFMNKVPKDHKYPLYYYLSILGAVGLTAYFGITEAAKPSAGQTLLMSAAAGAVGSVGGQIAKSLGCTVVGLAGSDEKCRWITEDLGFDRAINYKTCGPMTEAIENACPNGVDVYFDNVGGEMLDAALMNMNANGKIIFCGAISTYNATEKTPGPYNWWQILARTLTVKGFLVSDHLDQFVQGAEAIGQLIDEEGVSLNDQIIEGFDNTLSAYLKLFDGTNTGKLILKV